MDNPGIDLAIDLDSKTVALPDGRKIEFPIDGFSRYCLMNGLDQLGFLMEHNDAIEAFEAARA